MLAVGGDANCMRCASQEVGAKMGQDRELVWPGWWGRHQVEIEGWVHPDFTDVADALRRQLTGAVGGAAVCVYHRGKCVADIWGGKKDRAGNPWLEDTMAPSFSTTKGVASTMVHICADRGLLDYDDRVVDYWPEFGQAGKEAITIRQVMSHQSGLYHIRQMIDRADRMLDWKHMIAAIEKAEPIHEPGEKTGYHGLTYGFLVGEILQRVTGKSFSRIVRDDIVDPLGLDGMFIGAPKKALPRAAELMWFGRDNPLESKVISPWLDRMVEGGAYALQQAVRRVGAQLDLDSILDALAPRGISSFSFDHHDTLRAAIPAANGLFTARSLARMYAALSMGGARRSAAPFAQDSAACDPPAGQGGSQRGHSLRYALAPGLPRCRDLGGISQERLWSFRFRWFGRVGRPEARAGGGVDREQRHGLAARRSADRAHQRGRSVECPAPPARAPCERQARIARRRGEDRAPRRGTSRNPQGAEMVEWW